MGHAGLVVGTFEWVVPRLPYLVVYQVDELHRRVVIAAVFHGAQERGV
jgi:toxin ParE1/3/4